MRIALLTIAIAASFALAACTKAPSLPNLKKANGSGDSSGDGTSDEDANTAAPEFPTEIELVNTKFKGEESKLEAKVTYSGKSSERIKLMAGSSSASISVPKLTVGKSDTLVVEIYEGDKLRFKAKRLDTEIAKSKSTSFKIEDCLIQKLPWDGEKNETSCGWTISDVKN